MAFCAREWEAQWLDPRSIGFHWIRSFIVLDDISWLFWQGFSRVCSEGWISPVFQINILSWFNIALHFFLITEPFYLFLTEWPSSVRLTPLATSKSPKWSIWWYGRITTTRMQSQFLMPLISVINNSASNCKISSICGDICSKACPQERRQGNQPIHDARNPLLPSTKLPLQAAYFLSRNFRRCYVPWNQQLEKC